MQSCQNHLENSYTEFQDTNFQDTHGFQYAEFQHKSFSTEFQHKISGYAWSSICSFDDKKKEAIFIGKRIVLKSIVKI